MGPFSRSEKELRVWNPKCTEYHLHALHIFWGRGLRAWALSAVHSVDLGHKHSKFAFLINKIKDDNTYLMEWWKLNVLIQHKTLSTVPVCNKLNKSHLFALFLYSYMDRIFILNASTLNKSFCCFHKGPIKQLLLGWYSVRVGWTQRKNHSQYSGTTQ